MITPSRRCAISGSTRLQSQWLATTLFWRIFWNASSGSPDIGPK